MTAADSPDAAAFRRAICAAPADDLPRLVFADWLDEHGDAHRAEFVRVQCELARTPDLSARGAELAARSARLLTPARYGAWAAGVKAHKVVAATFGRGFVEAVTVYSKRFAAAGTAILAADPVTAVKLVNLHAASGSVPLAAVLAAPATARLRALDLSTTRLTGPELFELAAAGAGPLRDLDQLTVGSGPEAGLGDPVVLAAVAASLPALTRLTLTSADWPPDSLRNMVAAGGFRKIRHLTLPNAADLTAFAANTAAGGLRTLVVLNTHPGDDGGYETAPPADAVEALANSPYLHGVEDLTVHGCDGAQLDILAAGRGLTGLRYLRLATFDLDPAAVARLAPRFAPRLLGLSARYLRWDAGGRPPADWAAELRPQFPTTFLDLM